MVRLSSGRWECERSAPLESLPDPVRGHRLTAHRRSRCAPPAWRPAYSGHNCRTFGRVHPSSVERNDATSSNSSSRDGRTIYPFQRYAYEGLIEVEEKVLIIQAGRTSITRHHIRSGCWQARGRPADRAWHEHTCRLAVRASTRPRSLCLEDSPPRGSSLGA